MTCLVHGVGHGGADPGCVEGALIEKDWVLKQALACEEAIKPWGIEQHLTRRTDINPTARAEAQFASEHNADLVILHHVNTNPNPAVDGLMTFALVSDPFGVEVGDAIARAAPARLLRRNPKTTLIHPMDQDWPRVFTCLKYHTCPAVLIEYGFATSPKDLAILLDPLSERGLVAAVLAGVARMLELMRGV